MEHLKKISFFSFANADAAVRNGLSIGDATPDTLGLIVHFSDGSSFWYPTTDLQYLGLSFKDGCAFLNDPFYNELSKDIQDALDNIVYSEVVISGQNLIVATFKNPSCQYTPFCSFVKPVGEDDSIQDVKDYLYEMVYNSIKYQNRNDYD